MATSYTSIVAKKDNLTLNEFTWRCARAFGALVMMRDASLDAPIKFNVDDGSRYHEKALERAKIELTEARAMTAETAVQLEKARFASDERARVEALSKNANMLAKYSAILKKVIDWVPPSPDHVPLREFMIEQLNESINHDCSYVPDVHPIRTPEKVKSDAISLAKSSIDYHTREVLREKTRNAERETWLTLLCDSVGMPPQFDK